MQYKYKKWHGQILSPSRDALCYNSNTSIQKMRESLRALGASGSLWPLQASAQIMLWLEKYTTLLTLPSPGEASKTCYCSSGSHFCYSAPPPRVASKTCYFSSGSHFGYFGPPLNASKTLYFSSGNHLGPPHTRHRPYWGSRKD